jgi:hypothetical protein
MANVNAYNFDVSAASNVNAQEENSKLSCDCSEFSRAESPAGSLRSFADTRWFKYDRDKL